MNLSSLWIYKHMKGVTRRKPIDEFNGADLNDPVTILGAKPGCFCVKDYFTYCFLHKKP